jgi:protein-tyrosine kinase
MSKLYEALQQSGLSRPQPGIDRLVPATPELALASRQSMEALYQSLESALPGIARKVVLFSASRAGEGTTTIVREFAATLSLVFRASVLVVDANPNRGAAHAFGNVEAVPLPVLLRILQADDANRARKAGIIVATFDPDITNARARQLGASVSTGDALREHFDYVLFDAPALGASATAVSLAHHTDGVVIVIDSERTRWPVAENTKRTYESTGAKVIGVVLNKRAFHVPQWLYKWL